MQSRIQLCCSKGIRGMCVTIAVIGIINIFILLYLYAVVITTPKQVLFLQQTRTSHYKLTVPTSTIANNLKLQERLLKQSIRSFHRRTALCTQSRIIEENLIIPMYSILSNNSVKREFTTSWYFRFRFKEKDLKTLSDTLRTFDKVMSKIGINYTIYGGTLVGSYRHHGLVPWDDDVDVIVPLTASKLLYRAFKKLEPNYLITTDSVYFWKIFSSSANRIKCYPWKWPFVDIFFYAENETHIWNTSPVYKKTYVFPKNNVFPVRRRPYMGLQLLAPHNPSAFLAQTYNIGLCKSGTWMHRLETYSSEVKVPCSMLYAKFPFVFRKFMNGGCNESLIRNGTTISYFFDKNVIC